MPDVQAAYDQLAAERGFEPDPGITPGPVTRLLIDAESGRQDELESARLQPALRAPAGDGPRFVVGHLAYTGQSTVYLRYF
ncbi:MAG TPA: hypothetical protein VF504_03750, partial [Solirubrobacterales bacterium]